MTTRPCPPLLKVTVPRPPGASNPHYTFYYTAGFGSSKSLISLRKIGAIFIIIRRSGVRIPESPPSNSGMYLIDGLQTNPATFLSAYLK